MPKLRDKPRYDEIRLIVGWGLLLWGRFEIGCSQQIVSQENPKREHTERDAAKEP